MKKILIPVVAALLAIALVSCGQDQRKTEKQIEQMVQEKLRSDLSSAGMTYVPDSVWGFYGVSTELADESFKYPSASDDLNAKIAALMLKGERDKVNPIDYLLKARMLDRAYKKAGIKPATYYIVHRFKVTDMARGATVTMMCGALVSPSLYDDRAEAGVIPYGAKVVD